MIIASLNTIGDSHTVILPFEEQASGILSVGATFGGLALDRLVDVEYRHSADNATWSAWMTFDTATLSALTFDPDNALYQQIRATRTGTNTGGVISWEGFNIQLSTDAAAFKGRGSFTDTGLYGEVGDFLVSVIGSELVERGGAARFEVVKGQPSTAMLAKKPIICVSAVSVGDSSAASIHTGQTNCTALIQIAGSKSTLRDPMEGIKEFELMAGRISALFTANFWKSYTHNFTFKGVEFVGAKLADFGVTNSQVTRMENGFDHVAQLPFVQINIRFSLNYAKFTIQNV